MSISRLKPDEAPVHTLTVPVVGAPHFSQTFDLGSIRTAYATLTLIAYDMDTLTLGQGAGQVYWRTKDAIDLDQQPVAGRNGVDYIAFDLAPDGELSHYDPGTFPLPDAILQAKGISPRYLKVAASLWDVDTNLPYAGAQNPTADWSIYVEYV